jgi:hypothetical protein
MMPVTMTINGVEFGNCVRPRPPMLFRHLLAVATVLALAASFGPAEAGTIVLRILATNPADEPRTVQVKSNLPPRVGTNDIVNLGDLQLGYDLKNNVHYVYKEVELGAKETATYNVEIRDIWTIPDKAFADLTAQARKLAAKMEGHKLQGAAQEMQRAVEREMEQITSAQDAAKMKPGVRPIDHIRAYEANIRSLASAKRDVGRLENLVLAAGRDPGAIMGEMDTGKIEKPAPAVPAQGYATATYRLVVSNTSPEEARTVPVRGELPPEIRLDDIVDAGGLNVAADARTKLCYVYKDEVTIEPHAAVAFDVRVRDKWNVNGPRIAALKSFSTNMLARIVRKEKFASVEVALRGLIGELDSIAAERSPTVLNDTYVAFFRDQGQRLDELEQKIDRIASALQTIEKTSRIGFLVKPPSPRTTWLIIYIVLGFLAVVSLLFFLRWYGRTREEKM